MRSLKEFILYELANTGAELVLQNYLTPTQILAIKKGALNVFAKVRWLTHSITGLVVRLPPSAYRSAIKIYICRDYIDKVKVGGVELIT